MKPPYLQYGDKIAIISPSGNIDSSLIDNAAGVLESWGLVPVIGKNAKNSYGRYAGTPEERLEDLQWALDQKEIKAVLCSRGGYGLVQIIDDVDFSHFELYPKWLIGFSDITVLHMGIAAYDIASCHELCELFSVPCAYRAFICCSGGCAVKYTITIKGRLTTRWPFL